MANIFDMTPFQQYGLGNGFNYRNSLDWLFNTDGGMGGMPGLQAPPAAPNAPQVNPAAPQIPPMPGSLPGMGGQPPMLPPGLPPMLPPGLPPMQPPFPTGNGGMGLGGGQQPPNVGGGIGGFKGYGNK